MKKMLEENKKVLLLGNESIVRGALEGGIDFGASYPGTPASEIGDAFASIAKKCGIYYEYSTNEKVAMEIAAAASASNLRTLTCMKHVGLNVASDAFMTLAYTGVRGGLVIVTADDPSCHSSQNEQDNRYYSLLANMPMLEPSDSQECFDMSKEAFDLSEKLEMPVLLRTTTRVSHTSSDVMVGKLERKERKKGFFEKDPKRFVVVPAIARGSHLKLLERMKKAEEESEHSPFNQLSESDSKLGIVTSGVSYLYVKEALEDLGLKANLLKLGFTHPLPENLCRNFLKRVDRALVVEELEPFLENQLLALKAKENLSVEIHGKDFLPVYHEFEFLQVEKAIAEFSGVSFAFREKVEVEVPKRQPVLCPGCPHRNVFYIARQLTKGKAIFPNDIGCYTLGLNKPYEEADMILCMGSSVGTSCGFSMATDQPIVSFIGDSTFYHAGIPALINGVHNQAKFLLVVLDNRTTAMTGHQPTPGLPYNVMSDNLPQVMPEDIARGCGVKHVEVADGNNLKDIRTKMKRLLESDGVGVLVSRSPCILVENREKRKKGEEIPHYEIDQEQCNVCRICIDKFACPAFYVKDDRIWIADDLCNGCGACLQVCGRNAIRRKK